MSIFTHIFTFITPPHTHTFKKFKMFSVVVSTSVSQTWNPETLKGENAL